MHGQDHNICNKCGKPVGKRRLICDDCKASTCVACGAKRSYVRGSERRSLCLNCYGKYKRYSEAEKMLVASKKYEQMFNSQQTQIEELLEKNKDLTQQLHVVRSVNENRPHGVKY